MDITQIIDFLSTLTNTQLAALLVPAGIFAAKIVEWATTPRFVDSRVGRQSPELVAKAMIWQADGNVPDAAAAK